MHFLEHKIPPLLVALTIAVGMWLIASLMPVVADYEMAKCSLAVLLFFIGMVFVVLGIISFRMAKTTVNPMQPNLATSLITSGIYTVTRNPMYVGFTLFLFAWSAYLGSVWSVGLVVTFIWYIQRFQIIPEEKALERMFRDEFIAYRKRVRRWL